MQKQNELRNDTMKESLIIFLFGVLLISGSCAQETERTGDQLLSFGEGGQIKMLYDRRQRPQSVYLNGMVYIVFNAGGEKGAPARSPSKPMIVRYDPITSEFSDIVILGPEDDDHHYGPVIWTDEDDHLHVLYGCHSSPGTHLISKEPAHIGISLDDWTVGSEIAPKISYPTLYRISENKTLIYYRTAGHISSWTYRISDDNGKTWSGPDNDVTDLDSKGRFEWSSYQSKLPGKDGRSLHVVFTAYDDNRKDDPKRYYNPRYDKAVSNEWKYNLYYVKIDVETGEVSNFEGNKMVTPIDLDQANSKCMIWDTEWRGAGVPPDIVLDENGDPAFLHVLSGESTESHSYYFVHRSEGTWKKTPIAPANHQWNSCHINRDPEGIYHAYLVVGEEYIDTEWVEGKSKGDNFEKGETNYLKTGGYMDKHGGGIIEEWVSYDKGDSWERSRNIVPDVSEYPGWRYNNIQPVTKPDGTTVDGMLLFYGWKEKEAPEAKAFLFHEN
jgi:hypothetical protein